MSWTFLACVLVSFAWMGLFFLWGKFFQSVIHVKQDYAGGILFGYLLIQFLFQLVYLPFFLTRGSYRSLSFVWMGVILFLSLGIIIYLLKHQVKPKKKLKRNELIGICLASFAILGLAVFIALRVPLYGQDTRVYISEMNQCYYIDSMWINTGTLSFHSGMCSMFELFTISSLITGIKPYYIALFTIRILGIGLMSLAVYRIGVILFHNKCKSFCWQALILAVIVPFFLMFWGSMYTAEFFYWRINEAKGYCQFILLPIGFSIFLAMMKKDADRKKLWKEQLVVGLAAVSVSASSLTPYLFLLFMGLFALLAYDRFKNGWSTVKNSLFCALPNIIYLTVYIAEKKGIIVF